MFAWTHKHTLKRTECDIVTGQAPRIKYKFLEIPISISKHEMNEKRLYSLTHSIYSVFCALCIEIRRKKTIQPWNEISYVYIFQFKSYSKEQEEKKKLTNKKICRHPHMSTHMSFIWVNVCRRQRCRQRQRRRWNKHIHLHISTLKIKTYTRIELLQGIQFRCLVSIFKYKFKFTLEFSHVCQIGANTSKQVWIIFSVLNILERHKLIRQRTPRIKCGTNTSKLFYRLC